MTLNENIKQAITDEFEQWKQRTYGNLNDKQRKELGAFHTPPLLTIKMIEKFSDLEGTIMDPCAGSGNLIAGCILAGADPKLCYANEIDPSIYEVLVERLASFGVPKENITMMDALSPEFGKLMRTQVWRNEMLKVIANPPFRINRKKFTALLKSADEYVVIHTFKFCNNELRRFELVEYREWPEVTNVVLAIASSTMTQNYIVKPIFYKPNVKDEVFDGCEDYFIFTNTHFADGQYDTVVKQNRPHYAKKLVLKDITEDMFICKCTNKNMKVGDRLRRPVYPRSFIKIFKKHLDEIYMDTRLFGNIMLKYPLIRQEFVDELENDI